MKNMNTADTSTDGILSDHETIEVVWKSLTLTHVEYPDGDLVGKYLAAVSMLPLILVVVFVTLVLFKRDFHTLSYLAGVVFNEAVNFTLKHIIKEERPGPKNRSVHVTYGMPSSHSQLMGFFTSYFVLFLFIRLQTHNKSSILEIAWKALVALISICAFFTVAYSRVYLQYHTLLQVLWGGSIGITVGLLWFALTQFVLTPLFPLIESWPISQFLMLRDTTLIPNIMWFDYTAQRNESKSRQRRRSSANREKSQ